MRKIYADRTGGRTFSDDDIQREILHRRIQHLFDLLGKTVDLIDKENVSIGKIGQKRRQIPLLFNRGAGGDL